MRNGFTLVEMIILTALTALLAGLLMPSLSHSRQASYALKCQSNLRQIGLMHLSRDRWSGSVYDVTDSDLNHPMGNHDSGKKEPIRAEPFEGLFGGVLGLGEGKPAPRFQPVSKSQPTGWLLSCPVVEREGINSYGIREDVIGLPTNICARIAPDDVIFGCSDEEIVTNPERFAERHRGRVSFFFADSHVSQMSILDAFGPAKGSYQSGSGAKK